MTLLVAFNFLKFGLIDLIDIIVVAILLYQFYRLLRGTAAVRIFWGIAVIYLIWKIVTLLHLTMLSKIMSQFISVGVIALIVVFQPEIRSFLFFLGNTRFFRFMSGKLSRKVNQEEFESEIDSVVRACKRMSASRTGALILMARETPLQEYLKTGERIDALVSRELIENIFFKNSPLHDGALIICNHRLEAARCILPVSKDSKISGDLGLRHRSAIGSTATTDAIAIVVSEQTGQISLCQEGQIIRDISPTVLKQLLAETMTNRSALSAH
ncbi:MAG: diadenylate cyclase CdaA [Bacteroidales bacterium]|jgi:uncharacterized protein (TIGR00159 family)|nr:diadenylate cyclase CdaA [Bacteroidales bacterium]